MTPRQRLVEDQEDAVSFLCALEMAILALATFAVVSGLALLLQNAAGRN